VAPQILDSGSDKLSVVAGNSVSMQCKVSGIPRPSLLWLHNSEVLVQSVDDDVRFLTNDTLLQVSATESCVCMCLYGVSVCVCVCGGGGVCVISGR
jgi:hypothetical protein